MRRLHGFILVFIVIILGYALPANAEGWGDAYGIGTRAVGMGGAYCAVADDHMAAYYNMAGLGQIQKNIIALEFEYVKPRIDVQSVATGEDIKVYNADGSIRSDPTNGMAGDGLDFYAPVLGFVLNLNGALDPLINPLASKYNPNFRLPRINVGGVISLTENLDNILRTRFHPPDEPHFISYGDIVNNAMIKIGFGVEAIEKLLYLGAGVNCLPNGEGTLYAYNYRFSDNNRFAMQGNLRVNMMYSPQFGILVTPLNRKLKLGYSYRGHSEINFNRLDIAATIELGQMFSLPLAGEIYTSYNPDMHTFGVSYKMFDSLLIDCDLVLKKWGDFDYSEAEMGVFTEPYRDMYGMTGIIPNGPEFDDTVDIHLGAELKLDEHFTIRAGYQYRPTPVPNQSGKITNYIDMDQNIFSLGGSYHIGRPDIELLGAMRYFMFDNFTVDKTGVASVTWGEADFNQQQSYKVSGDAYMVSAGVKYTF
ncbi:MAG: outer membrane protein transport protein [Syntrophaceae bacterium]